MSGVSSGAGGSSAQLAQLQADIAQIQQSIVSSQSVKAWANFNADGGITINSSQNITSITNHSAGDNSLNFETAMNDANYGAAFMVGGNGTSSWRTAMASMNAGSYVSKTTNSFRFITGGGLVDLADNSILIFGN